MSHNDSDSSGRNHLDDDDEDEDESLEGMNIDKGKQKHMLIRRCI